ncbi:Neur-chan-memb domain-containing protein [Aphelenchoides bicaudatus]|nr:Neur-chan-memb domain-containing protein [Aphelenchoides bicaudatus]
MKPQNWVLLSPRRFKQQRRRRLLLLFGIQLFCFFHCAWTASSQETDQQIDTQTHQHRRHATLPQTDANETDTSELEEVDSYDQEDSSELTTVGQHKLRKHRSVYDNDNAHRALRRKEVPVNYRLYEDLLRNYNKAARPVRHPSQVVNVTMSAFLYQIFKLDAVKNTISLSGSFELYWQDIGLSWNPANYDGATEVFLPSSRIWLPELSLYYSVNFNLAVNLVSNNDAPRHVRWYLPYSTESLCSSVDVKFFPFDIQRCTLLFGSWAHSNDSIKFALYSQNLSLIDFYDNQEWQLDLGKSTISNQAFLYDYLDPPLYWEMILIELVVSRQSFYYVFNLIFPSLIISFVAIVGFHTPSTSGRVRDAKFRVGIMTLMSMSTIVVAVIAEMPKFGLSNSRRARGSFSGVPLIGLYYFMLLVIVGLSTMSTSITSMYGFRNSSVADPTASDALLSSTNANTSLHGHLNGFVQGRQAKAKQYAQSVALSLLKLIPNEQADEQPQNPARQRHTSKSKRPAQSSTQEHNVAEDAAGSYQHTIFNPGAQEEPSPPLRKQFRKRLSLAHYDNMLLYQYFGQQLEELTGAIVKIERSMSDMGQDIKSMIPDENQQNRWQTVIRRLELISLSFYLSMLCVTTFLFFYHDWYCFVGSSPCGPNFKCPWLKVESCG